MNNLFSKSNQEKGQGLVEYAIILALVAIVVLGTMKVLGPKIACTYDKVNNSLPGEASSSSTCSGSAPSGPQNFGSAQWKNGFDQATPINAYCGSEGTGASYNLYSINAGSYSYYIASGTPWTGSGSTFMRTGTCS